MTEPKIGMHGDIVVFLKSMAEWGYRRGTHVPIEHNEEDNCDFIYNAYIPSITHRLLPEDDGVIWKREYTEGRANWLNSKYEPAPMSEYRLNHKRQHAIENPDGRTAELMGHIDHLQQKLDETTKELEALKRRWDNVVGELPVVLSDDELEDD